MRANQYRFTSRWQIQGRIEDVYALLIRVTDFPRWWPSVYLDVREVHPGQADGTGMTALLHTRGRLPYTLRWQLRVIRASPPHGFTIEAGGDLNGQGTWSLEADGPQVGITFDWEVRADKPLLRYLSFIFKPLFAANHRWAMTQGEASLRRELLRRARTPAPVSA